jgi:cell division protein FtsZ
MGAVIDEQMQGRVEIVVIGTSDLGSRAGTARRPAPPPRVRPAPTENTTVAPASPVASEGDGVFARATTATGVARGAAAKSRITSAPVAQDEFAFGGETESRGAFDKTDRNLFEGQDLDVPTYFRKGIKIVL